jgi:transposase
MGGKRPYALEGERSWVLARIGEVPDLTLRAMTAELAARGIVVSHYAVWHFLVREGITFKKKPARQRARAA